MAATDSLAFRPTIRDAARLCSFLLFLRERRSKRRSPRRSRASLGLAPPRFWNLRRTAYRRLALTYGRCGGCNYQHASYEHQLEIKKEILRENLRRIAKLELDCEIQAHPSPPWNYRNRSRLQVRTRPEFAVGYFKFASHELLPVEECPISSPLINRGIAALWQAGRAGKAVEGVREVEFFANDDDTQLLVEFLCAPEARRAAVRAWAEEFCAAMPEIVGVAAFREPQKGVQSRWSRSAPQN